ncbi:response regulator transcription factor [Chloroflexi bacterium TSY]|nr:response regulator transcription factor [Chloroflexi bacterium TSY]
MIRILLVDDHTILRQGLDLILSREADFLIVGEATCGKEAVAKAIELEPDIIVTDIRLPCMNRIEATGRIRSLCPSSRVLFLAISATDDELLNAVQAGAWGILTKTDDASQLIETIRRINAGETFFPQTMTERLLGQLAFPQPQALTDREVDTLSLIGTGMTNKEIAGALGISQNTVKTHVRHILEKLQLRNRAEAAVYMAREGLMAGG